MSTNEARIINRDSPDEIDKSIIRLMEICESVQKSFPHPEALRGISVSYQGCGDDGEVLSVDYLYSGLATTNIPGSPDETDIITPPPLITYNDTNIERSQYEKLIQDEAFAIAHNAHGEWYNENGGSGFLIIDLERSLIQGEHVQYAEGAAVDNTDINAPYYYVLRRSVYDV